MGGKHKTNIHKAELNEKKGLLDEGAGLGGTPVIGETYTVGGSGNAHDKKKVTIRTSKVKSIG